VYDAEAVPELICGCAMVGGAAAIELAGVGAPYVIGAAPGGGAPYVMGAAAGCGAQ